MVSEKQFLPKIGYSTNSRVTFICVFFENNSNVFAEEYDSNYANKAYVEGYIVISDSISVFTEDGIVTSNGIRLRQAPNMQAKVLELMYLGESVKIDLDKSTMTFYYVERVKTGARGYVNRNYVQIVKYVK